MAMIRFNEAKSAINEIHPYIDGFYIGGFGALLRLGANKSKNAIFDIGNTVDVDVVTTDKSLEEKAKKYNFEILVVNFIDKEVKVKGLIGYFEYLYSPFYAKSASTGALWGGNLIDFFTESTGIGPIDARPL
jgi:hypothetical protein